MENWRLNWSVIRPDLVIGSGPRDPNDLDVLQAATGVSALLSLQHDDCLEQQAIDYPGHVRHGHALGLVMARVPLRDFDVEDQRRGLPDAVRVLDGLLRQDHRVYVHCTAGINRAPLVVATYLMLVEGLSLDAALALLQRARPGVLPSWAAYHGCCVDLTAQHADRIRQRATELGRGSTPAPDTDTWRQAERAIWREALTAE